jgi:hypothetical protein
MSYLVIYFLFGSFFNFVYKSGLAPDMRLNLRDKLLRLGDELGDAERAQREHASFACCADLRESYWHLLDALGRINSAALIEVERELRKNPRLREQVEARSASFERCEVETVRSLRARLLRIALQAIAINNGCLMFSILPAMPFLLASAKFRKWVLRLTVQAIDLHQQLGPAYVRVEHDVLRL